MSCEQELRASGHAPELCSWTPAEEIEPYAYTGSWAAPSSKLIACFFSRIFNVNQRSLYSCRFSGTVLAVANQAPTEDRPRARLWTRRIRRPDVRRRPHSLFTNLRLPSFHRDRARRTDGY